MRAILPRLAADLPRHLALVVALGATIVLAGWFGDLPDLRAPIAGEAEMKFNTALSLLALAASLLAWFGGRPGIARAAALLAAGLGGASLAEHLFDSDLGIDELVVADDGPAAGANPGRMAPITAVALTLAGTAMLAGRHRRPLWQGIALGVWLIAMFSALAYLYGAIKVSPTRTTPIAAPTAILLAVVATAMLAAQTDYGIMRLLSGPGAGSIVARRIILPSVIVIPLIGWVRLRAELEGLYGPVEGVAIYTLAFFLVLAATALFAATSLNAWQARAESGERRFGSVLEAATEQSIIATDTSGVITVFSGGAQRMLGWQEQEMVGRRSLTDLHDPAELTERAAELGVEPGFAALTKRVADTGEPETREWTYVRRDGGRLPVQLTLSARRAGHSSIEGYVAVAVDLTRIREAEASLRAAVHEAEEANRAKSDFLSRMSHELRTPLNAIIGYGQLMEIEGVDEQQAERLTVINRAGRHLLALINDVLDLARVEAGTMTVSLEPVGVGPLVEDSVALIEPSARERGIEVRVEGDPGVAVRADVQRLNQVMLNLLSNAIKYNVEGGRVDVAWRDDAERVEITVSDTGPGIPPSAMERLFVPFDRLQADLGGTEGTGLGLALSRRLVELMGGEIGVRSNPGEGTCFAVVLDSVTLTSVAPAPESAAPAADGAGGTVLYVEDNLDNIRLVQAILSKRPRVKLLTLMEGGRTVEVARAEDVDLVLLDLHLPDVSGRDVLRQLQTEPDTAEVPVVMVTADAMPGTGKALRAAGAAAVLTKPLDVLSFLAEVDRHLDADRSGTPSAADWSPESR